MKIKTTAAGLIAGVVAGCAAAPRTDPAVVEAWKAEAIANIPTCRSPTECDVKWSAARQFVLDHSGWKIQHMTADFIETFSPPTGNSSPAWRITKKPKADGSYVIESTTWCGNTYSDCSPPSWLALRDFSRFVNASWTPK